MNFATTSNINGYYPTDLYQASKSADAADKTAFSNAVAAEMAERTESVSLEEMLRSTYKKVYYNVMDTSQIDHNLWGRNDYPWDAYFKEPADEAVLSWKPTGSEPDMQSPQVHRKLNSMLGKVAIVVPRELEEKMQNNPELAQQIMTRIDNFIRENEASEPGTLKGYVITFDENGNINNACVTGEGKITVSSSEFADARKAREAKQAEYNRILEENALKRQLMEQLIERRNIHSDFLNSSVLDTVTPSAAISETGAMPETGIVNN